MSEIKTDVDRIVSLVKEKKQVSLDAAARILSIDRNMLMSLAESLEDNGIIEIKYRFTVPFLIDTGIPEESKKDKGKKQQLLPRKRSLIPKTAVPKKKLSQKETLKENIRLGILEIEAEENSTNKLKSDFDRILHQKEEILSKIEILSKHESGIKCEMAGLSRTVDFLSLLPGFNAKKVKELDSRFRKLKNEKKTIHIEIQNLRKILSI